MYLSEIIKENITKKRIIYTENVMSKSVFFGPQGRKSTRRHRNLRADQVGEDLKTTDRNTVNIKQHERRLKYLS